MRAALAVISVIVLAIHGVVFYNQLFARWQDHQSQYFQQAAKEPDTPEAVRAALLKRSPQIEQVIVRSFGAERVDRCMTCHAGIDDPRFEKADQPLRAHPKIPGHKFESFGCTLCHDGQGRAVEAKGAHEGGEDWPWPLLPTEMIEANCVQCHTDADWPGAPRVNAGRRLFFERACYTCHTIGGLSYGSIGPELTDVGRRRRHDYVRRKIENPRFSNPTSTMPRQDLRDEQRLALATFLKAQQGARISRAPLQQFRSAQQQRPEWLPLSLIVGPETASAVEELDPAKRGEELLPRVGCLSCHKLGDRDGRVGPEVAYTSGQRDHDWLIAHFRDPKSVVPGSLMPPYPLPADTFESLTRYLLARSIPKIAAEPAQQFLDLCARCHGEKGAADGVIAEYLDPRPRDLTKASFMKTKPRERLLRSVREGVAGTSMAPWGRVLGEAPSAALLDYVLERISKGSAAKVATNRQVPTANPVPFSKESMARGEATFLNRCWGCHGKKADGHGPNAESIQPRPRNLRNKPFLASVAYARLHESVRYGVQGTAMPAAGFDFALDEQAIGDLLNYVYGMNGMAEPSRIAQSEPGQGR
jgi:mono/diheme cytochrome c family protein